MFFRYYLSLFDNKDRYNFLLCKFFEKNLTFFDKIIFPTEQTI